MFCIFEMARKYLEGSGQTRVGTSRSLPLTAVGIKSQGDHNHPHWCQSGGETVTNGASYILRSISRELIMIIRESKGDDGKVISLRRKQLLIRIT